MVLRENVLAMVADCMAAGLTSSNVKFVLESALAPEIKVFESFVGSHVSFKQLSQLRAVRSALAEGQPVSANRYAFQSLKLRKSWHYKQLSSFQTLIT